MEGIADRGWFQVGNKPAGRLLTNCNIAVPLHIPQGFSVSIYQVDYLGYNGLPTGATSQLTAEYFLAGMYGPKMIRNFYGELDGEYLVTNKLVASALVWSSCGAILNAAIRVKTNSWGEQALA